MATDAFVRAWTRSRARVLTRSARQATESAERLRNRIRAFPEYVADLEAEAAALDDYAARCRQAAEDPTMPAPEYRRPTRVEEAA